MGKGGGGVAGREGGRRGGRYTPGWKVVGVDDVGFFNGKFGTVVVVEIGETKSRKKVTPGVGVAAVFSKKRDVLGIFRKGPCLRGGLYETANDSSKQEKLFL